MKKIKLTLTVLLLLCVSTVSAQWKVGAEAGMVSNYLKASSSKAQGRNGFRVGVVGNYTFFDKLRVETGLAYAQKGAIIKSLPGYRFHDFNEFDAHMKYFEVPILVGVVANVSKDVRIIPKFGLTSSFGLKSSWAYASQDGKNKRKVEVYAPEKSGMVTNYFDQYDCAVTIGLDVELFDRFLCKATYNMGLNTQYAMFLNPRKSKTLNVSVGYYFLRGKK